MYDRPVADEPLDADRRLVLKALACLVPTMACATSATLWGHHMGTTRMADGPDRGVVDASGRVHGMGNLYVTGSSVFPTDGAENPTLTIVALALRLGDRLREVLG